VTLTMEAWRLKMEPWRFYRPLVADSHNFSDEQDLDPGPYDGSDPDPH
jgi:hypothetical protein